MPTLLQNKNSACNTNYSSSHYLSQCATAKTLEDRYAAAWNAAKSYFNEPHAFGGPAIAYLFLKLLRAHAANGPRHLWISRLDCWRIVVDAMHFGGVRV